MRSLTVTVMATVALLAAWPAASGARQAAGPASPQAAADALLAADRAFSSASATVDAVTGMAAMFAPDVIMPGPPGRLHRGLAEATAALRASPDTAGGRVEWTPVGAGLSADGEHGFTFGFMTLRRQDGTHLPLKYMSYWVKGAAGWRVAGYKRARRPEGDVATTPVTPLLPATLVPPTRVPARLEALRQGLREAERAFSDEAQQVGLGAAFTKWGSPAAVNMGGPDSPGYVIGNAAIGAAVGAGAPTTSSPVAWSTDVALVASSGDLGISFGHIRPNGRPADGATPHGSAVLHHLAPRERDGAVALRRRVAAGGVSPRTSRAPRRSRASPGVDRGRLGCDGAEHDADLVRPAVVAERQRRGVHEHAVDGRRADAPALSVGVGHDDLVDRAADRPGDVVAGPGRRDARVDAEGRPAPPQAEHALDAGAIQPRGRAGVPAPPAPPGVGRAGVDVAGHHVGFGLVAVHPGGRRACG